MNPSLYIGVHALCLYYETSHESKVLGFLLGFGSELGMKTASSHECLTMLAYLSQSMFNTAFIPLVLLVQDNNRVSELSTVRQYRKVSNRTAGRVGSGMGRL